MDKNFKDKIERNRNKNFGMENKKYSPKTNKPKPITYERYFEGEHSYNTALDAIATDIEELGSFIESIYFDEENYENWFDESIYAVARYMTELTPALQTKQNIHTKFSISVNGFSVRLENNIALDVHCKYEINDGIATIIGTNVAITTHAKISKESYVNLTKEDSEWKKKEFAKRFNNRRPKEERDVAEY